MKKIIILALLALASFIFFFKLGARPLWDYDESIYAQVAQEAKLSSSQLGFTWYGNEGLYRTKMWFEKPPLMIWLIETGYSMFGINELGARVWVAIFALLTVFSTFFFVKKIYKSFWAGAFAVATFFIAFQFLNYASVLQFDIPVGFFVSFAIFCFALINENKKYFYLFWLSVALGVLTKSVIGLLPLPIVALYSLLSWKWGYFKNKHFWYGFGVFALIVLPWHAIESFRYGKAFWDQYLFYHVVERYATSLENNKGDFLFYIRILLKQRVIFFLSVAGFLYFTFKSLKTKGEEQRKWLIINVAVAFIVLFFSSSHTKLIAYILPVYPFLAVMVGVTAWDFCRLVYNRSKAISIAGGIAFVIACSFLAIKYQQYKLDTIYEPYFVDSKKLGLYLKNNYQDLPIYYYSRIGTKPIVIFYANRVVYYLPYPSTSKPAANFLLISEVAPDFGQSQPILSTGTQNLYLIE